MHTPGYPDDPCVSDRRPAIATTRPLRTAAGRPPVYTLQAAPGGPPIAVLRFEVGTGVTLPAIDHAHVHDFPVLAYFERPGGRFRIADREREIQAGDAFLIAPGAVVSVRDHLAGTAAGREAAGIRGWGVFFPFEVLGVRATGSFLGWHSHPLLFPFLGGAAGGGHHLAVPEASRASWSARMAALDDELRERREGYREAALAQLTLLLVDVARLAAHAVRDRTAGNDSLLTRVFDVIEDGYRGELSLRDVARQVGLTSEHLTTVVRVRTGRTVGSWITERRMSEARALLVQTDLPVALVAARVGYRDPAYFARTFRRTHGTTPRGWRAAAGAL